MSAPLRLRLDGDALTDNWRTLAAMSGHAACGAAIKADGYGLGAREVVRRLAAVGCRDFFVATWAEAQALAPSDVSLAVLHGVREEDLPRALSRIARPVLNTATQVARWKAASGGVCDVMVDTGMNRLGVSVEDISGGLLDGLAIDTLMSHLACADVDHALNAVQLERFTEAAESIPARRTSLANSAGICLGREYSFDLVRPGLALYGGVPRAEAADHIVQVARIEAQIVQRRTIRAGESCGYGATFVATSDTEAAILNIGYADGYLRGFSSTGAAFAGEFALPVLGRVSMDLLILDCSALPELKEGDWVGIDYDLTSASRQSGLSQYELLTGLGSRFSRIWR